MSRERIGEVAETLLDYFEHNKTFQGDKVMEVAAASYTDPAQFRTELELIFRRVPLMLALSCEMPKDGDYKAMQVADRPVVIVRDRSGVVRAFLNVCAHRWAPVATEGHGNCPRFKFTCPFHGWTYGADGKLIGIADQRKFGDVDKSMRGLRQLPCEERYGMIFVCLTSTVPLNLDAYYGELLEEFADAGLKDWAFLGGHVVEGANWKLTFNNFLESYHFAMLHPGTVSADMLSNMTHYQGFGPNMRTSVSFHSMPKLREVPRAQWGAREGQEFGFIRIFFPNVTAFLAAEHNISVFTLTLPGPTHDKSRTILLYTRKVPPGDESDRADIKRKMDAVTFDITRNEDAAIGVQIQKGLESGAHESLLYGRNERGNQFFHEWVNWYLRSDPGLLKPVL